MRQTPLAVAVLQRGSHVVYERHGFLVRRFYKDEAESGVAEDRKALRRLLRDCERVQVEAVIIPSLDGLSRISGWPRTSSSDSVGQGLRF